MALPHESVDDEASAPNIIILEGDEARAHFDAAARELVGMSGEGFLRRLDAGEWEDVIDDGEHQDHLHLAMIRSFAEWDAPRCNARLRRSVRRDLSLRH